MSRGAVSAIASIKVQSLLTSLILQYLGGCLPVTNIVRKLLKIQYLNPKAKSI
jgi:hypothetical protein